MPEKRYASVIFGSERQTKVRPLAVFGLVLLMIFFSEGVVLLIMPFLTSTRTSSVFEGLVDASVLTLVMAPTIWWAVVVPMQHALAERGFLLQRIFEAQDKERNSIARELHDGLGQQVASMLFRARAILETAPAEPLRAQLLSMIEAGQQTQEDIRRLSRGLRSGALEQFGLAEALERLGSDFSFDRKRVVKVDADVLRPYRFDRDVENSVYRIAQEAVTNAVRHGNAAEIEVMCDLTDDAISLTVKDNGIGFSSTAENLSEQGLPKGLGLVSMRERTNGLGGSFAVESVPGTGTTLHVTLPARALKGSTNG
jgi:signal transduction histidine kinase